MQPVDWKQVALDADRERGLESAEAEMQRTGDLHLYISKLKQEVQAQRNELAKRRTLLTEQKTVLESCIPLVEARRLAFKSLMKGTALERLSNMVSDNRRHTAMKRSALTAVKDFVYGATSRVSTQRLTDSQLRVMREEQLVLFAENARLLHAVDELTSRLDRGAQLEVADSILYRDEKGASYPKRPIRQKLSWMSLAATRLVGAASNLIMSQKRRHLRDLCRRCALLAAPPNMLDLAWAFGRYARQCGRIGAMKALCRLSCLPRPYRTIHQAPSRVNYTTLTQQAYASKPMGYLRLPSVQQAYVPVAMPSTRFPTADVVNRENDL